MTPSTAPSAILRGDAASSVSLLCGPARRKRTSDQLVIVESVVPSALMVGASAGSESHDGAKPLHIAGRLTNPRPHRSIYGRISSPRVRLREEELQSIGRDQGCVGEQARLVDGTEDRWKAADGALLRTRMIG